MTKPVPVENAEALTRLFGHWPSFHDAEVLSIHLDRAGEDGPCLDAEIHVFQMTNAVDEQGYYVLTNHTLVTLRFTNLLLRELRWFNAQNSLFQIDMEQVEPTENEGRPLRVSFDSNEGVEASFLCERITVQSVEPFPQAV